MLKFPEFLGGQGSVDCDPPPILRAHLFSNSPLYRGVHTKIGLPDRAKSLALKLFCDYSNHISTRILLNSQKWCLHAIDLNRLSIFSGQHCVSFGVVEIVATLAAVEGCDINQSDGAGNTPLAWAAWNGHEGAVEILLGRRDVNRQTR